MIWKIIIIGIIIVLFATLFSTGALFQIVDIFEQIFGLDFINGVVEFVANLYDLILAHRLVFYVIVVLFVLWIMELIFAHIIGGKKE